MKAKGQFSMHRRDWQGFLRLLSLKNAWDSEGKGAAGSPTMKHLERRPGGGTWSGSRTRLPMTLLSSPAMTSPSSSSLALPSWETQSSLPASLLPATSCQMRRPATSAAGAVSIVCADPSSWPQGQWAERQGLGTKIEGNTRTSPCIFFHIAPPKAAFSLPILPNMNVLN